jgi:hypothetical protein
MGNRAIGFILSGGLLFAAILTTGCSKGGSPGDAGQTATVKLKDGGSFSGAVTKNDTSAITLKATSGETRTYPMNQVDAVQYSTSPAPGAAMGNLASVPGQEASRAAPPAETSRTLPAGTTIAVRNSDTIKAGSAETGQTFPGVIVRDVIGSDGGVVIPKGSNALLAVRASQGQGKVKGQSEIVIDLDSVEVAGRHYDLDTSDIARKGKQGMGKNRRSAKFIGGGAVLGTIIGAVAGGGAGAAIGAGAGAGAGAGLQAVTRGKAVRIPAESVLSFKLEAPVDITPEQ